jgi:hypothetical protein
MFEAKGISMTATKADSYSFILYTPASNYSAAHASVAFMLYED